MKKILLATGIFLTFSLMASAQQKKAATKTNAAVQPTVQPAPLTKGETNRLKLTTPKDDAAKKNEILKAREAHKAARVHPMKKTKVAVKTTGN